MKTVAVILVALCLFIRKSSTAWDCELYSEDDDLVCCDKRSLPTTIYDSKWAWVVEFYSSWCGHCQHFAPTWKQFAHSLKNWAPVVRVAVIDCSSNGNSDACRHLQIEGYPSIKMFHAGLTKNASDGGTFAGNVLGCLLLWVTWQILQIPGTFPDFAIW
eukprot:m.190565 g.190565  ORF g.190565 m.190565 type:complete len:159 (+) comp39434_c1_seq7:35-511(+)